MPVEQARIGENLAEVQGRIEEAARKSGRTAEEVRLIAVTKTVGLDEVNALYDLGVREFGENRVAVAGPKIDQFDRDARWHMIGNVQRRKCPEVVRLFDCVDAVDRVELAEALQRRCDEQGKDVPVLLEVNVSGEEAKHGFSPAELPGALDAVAGMPRLKLEGFLTMAPFFDDAEEARPVFAGLRELAEKHGVTELSMGMTNDYVVAVEEGATQVRIGSALFK